jgi:hypothetical protein
LGGEFQVNSYTDYSQFAPAVAMDGSGNFVVVWESYYQDGYGDGIFGRRFDSSGLAQATEFQINTSTDDSQYAAAVAMDGAGGFVVVWQSNYQDGSGAGVFARRFASSGLAVGGEFQVNASTEYFQGSPAVAATGASNFVVVWQDYYAGTMARRVDSSGQPTGDEFQVNNSTGGYIYPKVAGNPAGFLVVWAAYDQALIDRDILGRQFGTSGMPVGGEFQINTTTAMTQNHPAVAANAAGGFVVVWQSEGQDGSGYGVFGQRFAAEAFIIDVDGNGEVDALTDALLILRYIFGFRDATLIAGAVGPGCTRCLADEIESFIAANITSFDVDGNGDVDALTDALLILRYVFGFRGATLIAGAVGPGCTRCLAPEIEGYLDPLVP